MPDYDKPTHQYLRQACPRFESEANQLGPGAHSDLFKEPLQHRLDDALRDAELRADLLVAEPLHDEAENLPLAAIEFNRPIVGAALIHRLSGEIDRQPRRHPQLPSQSLTD